MIDETRIGALTTRLAVWCEQCGHETDAAGRVDERVAGEILGRSPNTLRNWRAGPRPLPFYAGRPVKYAVADLARFLESTRSDDHASARNELPASAAACDRRAR